MSNETPNEKEVMETMMRLAQEYKADMKPANGVITFVLPAEDKSNPAGRTVQIDIDTKNNLLRMSDVRS